MSIRIGDKILAGTYNAEDLLMSPSFSGVPTTPTASRGDSSKQIANTEYVQNELAAFTPPTVINLDNNSITKNADDEIQTVGVIERNKGELMCDWVGTLEEYTAQNIETEHPEWTCYITDDDEFNEALVEGDNVSLLTNDVGYIGNKQITNCITEIPQDIKLELVDGTLTVKAGSKVYVPNGFEADGTTPKFDIRIIESDTNVEPFGTDGDVFQVMFAGLSTVFSRNNAQMFSGSTAPTSTTYMVWYDTTNNLVKHSSNKGSTWSAGGDTFPLSISSTVGSSYTSIKQVFNGFGYIGSTLFALPGVKGLIPNGRNEDGTLKNTEFVNSSVRTFTCTQTFDNWPIIFGYDRLYTLSNFKVEDTPSRTPTSGQWISYYSPKDNKIYQSDNGGDWFTSPGYIIGNESALSGKVTSLNLKTTFRALDYNDKPEITGWSAPGSKKVDLTFGASGATYTAPANGWLCVYGIASVANGYIEVAGKLVTGGQNAAATGSIWVSAQAKKGDVITIRYANYTNQRFYFRYAEGEI